MTSASAFQSSSDLKLSAYPQIDEAKNPDIYGDLQTVHAAVRVLQQYIDAYTGAQPVCKAGASINAGQFISLGTGFTDLASVVLANASNHLLPCFGFAVTSAISGQGINIQTSGIYPYGNGNLIPGTKYYLSTTPGQLTATPPSAGGNLVQFVGVAIDTSNFLFRPSQRYSEI